MPGGQKGRGSMQKGVIEEGNGKGKRQGRKVRLRVNGLRVCTWLSRLEINPIQISYYRIGLFHRINIPFQPTS
jgi:hypothetical protein